MYSAGSDGVLLRWAATTSVNGDLYSIEEEMEGHEGSVLCCAYSEDLDVLIRFAHRRRLGVSGSGARVSAGG